MSVTSSDVLKQEIKFPVSGERDFYKIFLELSNLTKDSENRLVGSEIDLISILMAEPLEFTLMFNQKSKNKEGETINQKLAKVLKTTVGYILLMMKNLRNKGTLIVTDGIVEFSSELEKLRNETKQRILNFSFMPFEYIFRVKVTEDDEESDEERDSSN